MRELNNAELNTIQGAGNYSNTEVITLSSAGAALAGGFGYYMSYDIFSMTEGLLFVSASTIPTCIATGLLLGSIALYHYALDVPNGYPFLRT